MADGELATSWFSAVGEAANLGSPPSVDITLVGDATVSELRIFGNRQFANNYDIFEGRFELFGAGGTLLFDSGLVALPAPARDAVVPVPSVGSVRRVRFTSTDDENNRAGLSELEVYGAFALIGGAPPPDIALPATGSVVGTVTGSSEPASVVVEGRDHESRTGVYQQTDSVAVDETYAVAGVPAGGVSVTIVDGVAAGVNVGTVTEAESTTIDTAMGTATRVPAELGVGARLEVQADGVILGDGAVRLSEVLVNGKAYPALVSAAVEIPPDTELVFGPARTAGLRHTRKVFVPIDARFVRYLEIFENPHGFDVEVTVRVRGEHAGDAGVAVVPGQADHVRADGASYEHEWQALVVPANGRVILMHFAVQAPDAATATAVANALAALSDEEATEDLDIAEKQDIMNFNVP